MRSVRRWHSDISSFLPTSKLADQLGRSQQKTRDSWAGTQDKIRGQVLWRHTHSSGGSQSLTGVQLPLSEALFPRGNVVHTSWCLHTWWAVWQQRYPKLREPKSFLMGSRNHARTLSPEEMFSLWYWIVSKPALCSGGRPFIIQATCCVNVLERLSKTEGWLVSLYWKHAGMCSTHGNLSLETVFRAAFPQASPITQQAMF